MTQNPTFPNDHQLVEVLVQYDGPILSLHRAGEELFLALAVNELESGSLHETLHRHTGWTNPATLGMRATEEIWFRIGEADRAAVLACVEQPAAIHDLPLRRWMRESPQLHRVSVDDTGRICDVQPLRFDMIPTDFLPSD